MSVRIENCFRERLRSFAIRIALGCVVGVLCGGASALFLWALNSATDFRNSHEVIVFALPLAGLAIGLIYERWGFSVIGGSSLLIERARFGGAEIPVRMAPMVLGGTLLTHLFGGSAGREGTAVQIGASMSDWISHRCKVDPAARKQLLLAGIAGGFGSVFGTPIAGVIFALEVVATRRIAYAAFAPALVAAAIGDWVTRALGTAHSPYVAPSHLTITPILLLKWLIFAVAVACTVALFIELTHSTKRAAQRMTRRLPVRLFFGGCAVIALWQIWGSSDYLGLGVETISRSFVDSSLPSHVFAAKMIFTAVTIGAGFIGGEVTPLFFIGAALGNTMAQLLGLPMDMAAGVGMAAAFAAASNTPFALSVMAVELLGANLFPHVLIVCVLAYLMVGKRSIYASQMSSPDLD